MAAATSLSAPLDRLAFHEDCRVRSPLKEAPTLHFLLPPACFPQAGGITGSRALRPLPLRSRAASGMSVAVSSVWETSRAGGISSEPLRLIGGVGTYSPVRINPGHHPL